MQVLNWESQLGELLLRNDFARIAEFYEEALNAEPDNFSHYWYLGLAYLLQGNEIEAQSTWLYVLGQVTDEQLPKWIEALISILDIESIRQLELGNFEASWLIRQHIKELVPLDINNLLSLLNLSIKLDKFEPRNLIEWQLIDLIKTKNKEELKHDLMDEAFKQALKCIDDLVLEFLAACLPFAQNPQAWISDLVSSARAVCYILGLPHYLCLELVPDSLDALEFLPRFLLRANRFQEAIEAAQKFYELSNNFSMKLFSSSILLRTLLLSGSWSKVPEAAELHKTYLTDLASLRSDEIYVGVLQNQIVQTGNFAYLQDNLTQNRSYQNKIANLFLQGLRNNNLTSDLLSNSRLKSTKKLKIGYIGSTFRSHSVGWLCRWLFLHHNRENFEIYIYALGQSIDNPFFQTWFERNVDSFTSTDNDIHKITQKIVDDEIDILIDLDSYTSDYTCFAMANRSAPVQVTWLGTDASGLETIDYFIADPYVLPEHAQEHYQEIIWRLPETYIAVDGFEVDVPSLRREDLNIPNDAIVYFSSQAAVKRHPEILKLQMEIIKAVPNSYFLIKGLSDTTTLQEYFAEFANELNLNVDRLRFLEDTPTEYSHRANLQIADVVLDTYPYSGATTTLETLWIGIPLVTRVGEIFSSRNSYAFLMNAGVTEGISWSSEEYVEWGVRFGTDEKLRQQVSWKLRKSRHSSPLWNAKKFTREMENAYEQMWQRYCSQ
jgi:predicted O-linked N-acetylglucosamine transferase (SPINDLY family)